MIGSICVSRRFAARVVLSAALGLVGTSRAARADILAYDSFTGPAGSALPGTNDGTGFKNAWRAGSLGPDNSSNYVLQQHSLTGGAMPSSGGRVASLASYSLGSGVTRDLNTPFGTPGTTAFISFLVRPDGTLNEGASGGFFGLALNASTTTPMVSQDLFIGKGSSSSYGIENVGGNNSQLSNTQAVIGVTTQLLVEADFAANGADKFTLYVDPSAGNMVPAAVKQDSFLGMINSISIYSTGAFSIDEITISSSLGDIVPAGEITSAPEPASVVMLTLGGLAVVAGRRFRRTRATGKVVADLL